MEGTNRRREDEQGRFAFCSFGRPSESEGTSVKLSDVEFESVIESNDILRCLSISF